MATGSCEPVREKKKPQPAVAAAGFLSARLLARGWRDAAALIVWSSGIVCWRCLSLADGDFLFTLI